ncbi:MAG: TolC family protein [Sulfuriferula sp.]
MKTLPLFIAVTMLSGCATYHAQPLDLPAMAQSYENRTLNSPALQNFMTVNSNRNISAWPLKAWDLKALTLAAYYYSPDLDVARAQWGTARASITTAAQRPNPTLFLPFQYTAPSSFTVGQSPWTFGLGLDIPVETAGKRGYRVAQATQLSDAALFNIGNVAWQVRSRLRTKLLNLYAVTGKASILAQQTDTQGQIVAMLKKRLSLGAASAPEVNQALITLIQKRTDLANVQKQMQDARVQLASAIGVPVSALSKLNFRFDVFERAYPDIQTRDARRLATLNRADILGALAQYQASQAALQLQIANQYPDIHLDPGYTWVESEDQISFGASGIALPIFNHNQGPIAQAEARRSEAEAKVKFLQAQAFNEMDGALVNYHAALKNLSQSEILLAAQSGQLASVQSLFSTGEADRLVLALAQQATYISRLARQQASIQVQQAIGRLEDAMQRPLQFTSLKASHDKDKGKPPA